MQLDSRVDDPLAGLFLALCSALHHVFSCHLYVDQGIRRTLLRTLIAVDELDQILFGGTLDSGQLLPAVC
jgi:hypothetical protein